MSLSFAPLPAGLLSASGGGRNHRVPVESERIASIIIEFYRQGVRDEKQLRAFIDVARGFIDRSLDNTNNGREQKRTSGVFSGRVALGTLF